MTVTIFMMIKREVFEKMKEWTPQYRNDMNAYKPGEKIYAAPWCQLGHMGSYTFEGMLPPEEEPVTVKPKKPAKKNVATKSVATKKPAKKKAAK